MMPLLQNQGYLTPNSAIGVRKATLRDISTLLGLAKEFIEESAWGWHYNEDKALNKFSEYFGSDECEILLAVAGNKPVGWAMIAFDDEFHDERLGYVSKFFISKQYRGTSAARQLMAACNQWFDVNECSQDFATATANIPSENKLFENLAGKSGYQPCGQTLMRKRNYE